MARTIWKYTLTKQEQQLWDCEDMRGWRAAMEGFVEDEARDQGFPKYAIYGRDEELIIKDSVSHTVDPSEMSTS